jgi:carbon-monoxide dehydrogenase medium subunit
MIPASFDYMRPNTVEAAVAALKQGGDGAKVIAGGHSLLPMMKLRFSTPELLIDINELRELKGIEIGANEVSIGATTTHAELEHHSEIGHVVPLIARVAPLIADPPVRNRGTIGGAIVHSDPTADWPAVMLAVEAVFDVLGSGGQRSIAAEFFFKGLFETSLNSDEILVRIRIPRQQHPRAGYRKFRHPASGYAVVGAAVTLNGIGESASGGRIAFAGFADHAFRDKGAEALLAGYAGDPEQTAHIVERALRDVTPLEDRFADAEYRFQLGRTELRRALADAIAAP